MEQPKLLGLATAAVPTPVVYEHARTAAVFVGLISTDDADDQAERERVGAQAACGLAVVELRQFETGERRYWAPHTTVDVAGEASTEVTQSADFEPVSSFE